jgi:hypothetical protein
MEMKWEFLFFSIIGAILGAVAVGVLTQNGILPAIEKLL